MATRIEWYWNRLRCMSVPEVVYRARKTAYGKVQELGFLTAGNPPQADFDRRGAEPFVGCSSVDVGRYRNAGDRILAGWFKLFELGEINIGAIPRWNRDPKSGTDAPLVFGKTLDYRDESRVGDIKYLWEPNRHLQLVKVAQTYQLTKESKYLDGIRALLESWFDQCPYPLGANWTSSLELGIRLINWSLVWQLIGGLESPAFKSETGHGFRDRWLRSVHQHAHFVNGHFSRYSSGNNHLIGEAAGLFVASVTWPHWRATSAWRARAQRILEREVLAQNAEDGVNREQAVSYQQFVLDFLLVSALAGRAADIDFSGAYWDRIEAMLEFIASIMDSGGHTPMIGDADDGYLVRLETDPDWCPYKSLLATGAVLFDRPSFKWKAGPLDEKTCWLLGNAATARYQGIPSSSDQLPVRRAFAQGGYYILGTEWETEKEIRCCIDAGPLGYQRIAAHGHADALSLILNVGGKEFLIDPGTYAYHTQKKWRDYFRGTSAHNTVRVDGTDQSVSGGNFMWLKHASARCEVWEYDDACDHFVGVHDGYGRLQDPVTHRREIRLDKSQRTLIVTDTLECRDRHEVEVFWHFSPACAITVGEAVTATNDGTSIVLRGDSSFTERVGDEDVPAGWISPAFGIRIPTTTVIDRRDILGTTQIVTTFECLN